MGCTSGQQERSRALRIPTQTGILSVTLLNCILQRSPNSFMAMDPYAIIKVSNQQHKSQTRFKAGFNPQYDETFTFFINSQYKQHGRSLQILMMDRNKVASDSIIAYGIIDLDSIIKGKQQKHDIKCRLNFQCDEAGYANLRIHFKPEKSETIVFRYEDAMLEKQNDCSVQVVIGEEVLETSKAKDTKDAPPTWGEQLLTFLIPFSIQFGQVRLMNGKKVIGSSKVDLKPIMETTEQMQHKIQLKKDQKIVGTLEFSSIRGQKAMFSPIKKIVKKILAVETQIKKQQVPKQINDPKKQQIKEEKPKEQQKKQSPKEEKKEEQPKQQEKQQLKNEKFQQKKKPQKESPPPE